MPDICKNELRGRGLEDGRGHGDEILYYHGKYTSLEIESVEVTEKSTAVYKNKFTGKI